MKLFAFEIFLCTVRQKRATRLCLTWNGQHREPEAVATLENNRRVWWPSWHLHNPFFFFLFKSMTSPGPLGTVQKPAFTPTCAKLQQRKTVSTQRVTRAELNTLTKPEHAINLWLVRTFRSQTCIWYSKIQVGFSRSQHMRTCDLERRWKLCRRRRSAATEGREFYRAS